MDMPVGSTGPAPLFNAGKAAVAVQNIGNTSIEIDVRHKQGSGKVRYVEALALFSQSAMIGKFELESSHIHLPGQVGMPD